MPDANFATWLTSGAPPAWGVFVVVVTIAFKFYPLWKQRWTEARTAEDAITGNQWTRLTAEIERLDSRCCKLEESEERCRSELADAKNRIAELEGYNIGVGKSRQEAAGIVARERLADRNEREGKK